MKNQAIFVSLLFLAYPFSAQAAVYKCSIDGVVSYQDTPCEAGQSAIALVDATGRVSHSNSPLVFKQESEPRSSFQRTGLVAGMTDTEVLNLRGWGPPGKITRSRENHAWHEEWHYHLPTEGQKRLQFANGKLTAVNVDPAGPVARPQMAQTTPQ